MALSNPGRNETLDSGRRRLDQHGQPMRRRGGRERMKDAGVWRFGGSDDGLVITYQAVYGQPRLYRGECRLAGAH